MCMCVSLLQQLSCGYTEASGRPLYIWVLTVTYSFEDPRDFGTGGIAVHDAAYRLVLVGM